MFKWIDIHNRDSYWAAAIPDYGGRPYLTPDQRKARRVSEDADTLVDCLHGGIRVRIKVCHFDINYFTGGESGESSDQFYLQCQYGFAMDFMYPLIRESLTKGRAERLTESGKVCMSRLGNDIILTATGNCPPFENQLSTLYPLTLPVSFWRWVCETYKKYPRKFQHPNKRTVCPCCGQDLTGDEGVKAGVCFVCGFKEKD